MQKIGNTSCIESTLQRLKTTAEGEVEQRGNVGAAGTDCFLSGLFGTGETNPEDLGVGEQDWDEGNQDSQGSGDEPIDVIKACFSTRQFDHIVVMTGQPVYDVPTQR